MIDLDAMREKWAAESLRLNRQALLTTINGRLRSFTAWHAGAWFACILWLGNFIFKHFAEPRLAIPAAALDVYAISFLIALVRQIVMVGQIDYGQPVTVIQKRLEAVRILRIRTTQWAVLAGTILWAPFLIVVTESTFGAAWLVANLAFGLAVALLAIWASKKFSERLKASPFIQRVMNDLAGNNLNAATAFLKTLAQFEKGVEDGSK